MNKDIKWVCFDGGYDFAYLIRMLEGQYLPDNETQFYSLLNIYFPSFYDVKYMVRDMETLRLGGLNKIAAELSVFFENNNLFILNSYLDKKIRGYASSRK